MSLFLYQAVYTPESWAAQVENPQDRIETVARQACEAVGGRLVVTSVPAAGMLHPFRHLGTAKPVAN